MSFFYSPSSPDSFLKRLFPYVLLIAIGLLLYGQTFRFDFTYCDDNNWIISNRFFLKDKNLAQAFKQDPWSQGGGYYRPMVTLLLMFEMHFGGTAPNIYHVSNVLIHLVCACLLYVLLLKLKCSKDASLVLTLIFIVHPVLSSSVAWIPGRMDAMLALYVFPYFIAFIHYLENKQKPYLFLHLFFFATALFTKETAIMLPLGCLILSGLVTGKFFPASMKPIAVTWIVLMGLWFVARKAALGHYVHADEGSMVQKFIQNFPVLIQQMGKTLLPFNLTPLPTLEDTSYVFGIIALLLYTFILFWSKLKHLRRVFLGVALFIAFLVPSYLVTPAGDHLHTDNHLYLPMLGFLIVLMEIDFIRNLDLKNRTTQMLTAAVVFILFTVSFVYSKQFKNRFTFFMNAAEKSPHSTTGLLGLANNFYLMGNLDAAEGLYKKTIELQPQVLMAYNNLGLIYTKKAMWQKAEEAYVNEIKNNPNADLVYANMGLMYYKIDKLKEAGIALANALTLNPNNIDALNTMALVYYEQKQTHEAAALWKKILLLDSEYINAYQNLVTYYYDLKDFPTAIYYINEIRKRGIEIPFQLLKALNLN